jgi:hypothetical protein
MSTDNISESSDSNSSNNSNVTFATGQGKEFRSAGAQLVAIDYKTKDRVWVHDKYFRYYDVDPLDNNTVLFAANSRGIDGFDGFIAVIMNWKTGEVHDRFPLPADTHDIDRMDNGNYVIASKANNSVYIYNRSTETVVWEYRFKNHHPPYPEAGGKETGYTHLNDVDSVSNNSEFLVSPRNFDRVMLINRSSKEIEWTLGEENNYEILNEQHNPTLLSKNPPTVLVADSENHRVVEYTRFDSKWEKTWVYQDLEGWPRDADRLPNGNTLIVDTWGQRILEVTPDKRVVWQAKLQAHGPYDVERIEYGDEPQGPPMYKIQNSTSVTTNSVEYSGADQVVFQEYDTAYHLSQWVLPSWLGKLDFGLLIIAGILSFIWTIVEVYIRIPAENLYNLQKSLVVYQSAVLPYISRGAGVIGLVSVGVGLLPGQRQGLFIGLGILLIIGSVERMEWNDVKTMSNSHTIINLSLKTISLIVFITLILLGIHSSGINYTYLILGFLVCFHALKI